ncbi:MAG TPA: prenyltransferase, partial [Planctomycetota bacterium]|nr:prenyltransferase [Planctomycetota bacterium]
CQNQYGGWRYNPFDRELDLSVTVCQVQALRAARNIGIKVPSETIDRAIGYVKQSRTDYGRDRGLFYYKIHGRGAYDKNREYAINAAALTALSSAGIYEPALHDPVLDFLTEEYPRVASWYGTHFYFWYGNYYACQAFFQTGGPRFERYFLRISQDLLEQQRGDGRWENSVGPGDEFSTAIACIVLQLPKQYLPIFQR